MSTRGTVIFCEKEFGSIRNLNNNQSIYIHHDMYPNGFLPRIREFLSIKGAKNRAYDSSYLSAWFVGFIVNKQSMSNMWDYGGEQQEQGFNLISEIRKDLTRARKSLKELVEERQGQRIPSFKVRNAMGLDPNKIIKKCDDFTGIGLQIGLNDWCDYTYVIVPQSTENDVQFRIYTYNAELELIDMDVI